jgi:hypothetical protein
MFVKNFVIPITQFRYGNSDELDLESICQFMSMGYFLGDTTYFRGLKQILPATEFELQGEKVINSKEYFSWHYNPKYRPFDEIYEEFVSILENSVKNASENVVIPISGGLDSRTLLVAALKLKKNIKGYSYHFQDGWNESKYGKTMSRKFGFDFKSFEVQEGGLWNYLDDLSIRNQCYSEFTHPRQFAFYEELKNKFSGTFLLGHGGDLFFDHMNVSENLLLGEQHAEIFNRMVKPSGYSLGNELWKQWGLSGSFHDYLTDQIFHAYNSIQIQNVNAHFRAFKSKFYVPRWTCTNLEIFNDFGPVKLPYFEDEMCKFICNVPEKILAGRKLQIEYIKRNNPTLANLEWESHKPFNLNNYRLDRAPFNYPYRGIQKLRRTMSTKKYIQRNWELQFLGKNNFSILSERILSLESLVDKNILSIALQNFKNKPNENFHGITMLLTLAQFKNNFFEKQ